MRRATTILAAAALSAWIPARATPLAHPVPTVQVCGSKYSLVHASANATDGSSYAEYARRGDSAHDWTRLVTVHHRPPAESPKSYIQSLSEGYASSHPGMKFSSGSDPNTGAYWMDAIFIAPPSESGPSAKAVEWSFFRATPHPEGPRVLQYSERRFYKKTPDEIFNTWDLLALRKKLLPRLLSEPAPQ